MPRDRAFYRLHPDYIPCDDCRHRRRPMAKEPCASCTGCGSYEPDPAHPYNRQDEK